MKIYQVKLDKMNFSLISAAPQMNTDKTHVV